MKLRRVYLIALLAALCGLLPARGSAAQSIGNIVRMSVSAGFDGRFQVREWLPITIRIANDGPPIEGELRIRPDAALQLNAAGYATPISLPTQSSKQVFLYAALNNYNAVIQIDLVAPDGAVIQSASAPLTQLSATDILIGVLSEAPGGVLDLSASRSGSGVAQAALALDELPPFAQALQSLDILYFNDIDTGKLLLDRRHAVEDWVLAGGHLVVGGGPNWQKTAAAFPTLLPFIPSGTGTLTNLNAVAAFAGYASDALAAASIPIAQGTLVPGARVLLEQEGNPLIIRRALGAGTVDYLAFDPGLEPIRGWGQRASLWTSLFSTLTTRPGWSRGVIDENSATRAITTTRGLRLPDVAQLVLFLFLYVVIIGPINYFVLRALRRLEWAWATIPLIILLTSVGAYLVGANLRGTLPTISRLQIVQQWPGEARSRVDGVTGVLAPRRGTYSVEAGEGVALRPLFQNAIDAIPVVEGARFSASRIAIDAGLSANFHSSAYTAALPLTGSARVTLVRENQISITGEVQNTSAVTLTDAVVLCVNTAVSVGTLEPGEKQSFNFTATLLDYAVPSLLNGGFDPVVLVSARPTSLRNSQTRDTSLAELLLAGGGQRRADNLADVALRRRQDAFAHAVASDAERGTGRGFAVYFAGWVANGPVVADARLPEGGFNTEDLTLYVATLQSQIAPPAGTLDLAPGQTIWTPLTRTTLRDYSPYSLYIIGGDSAAFQFNPHPAFALASVSSVSINVRRTANATQGIIALWDWQAGKWDDLATPSGNGYTFTSAADIARYTGPGAAVRVQVRAPGSAASYDRIDVSLSGIPATS